MDIDPRFCVAVERSVGTRLRLILIDGKIELSSQTAVDELVLQERLTVVSRNELREMVRRYKGLVNWDSLLQDSSGTDDPDCAHWKRIARLQEQFRSQPEGFTWWARFCATSAVATCLDVLQALIDTSRQHRVHSPPEHPTVDWLELLRQAMAGCSPKTLPALRESLRRLFDPPGQE